MSTENNAESAQDGVQMTSAGESGPPDATNATPVSVSPPGGNESAEATPKPGPASEAFGSAIQALAGTSDNPEAAASTADPEAPESEVSPEDRIAEATARAEAAERVALQYHAAAAAGLPLDLAGRLQGTTAQELASDAKALLAHLKPKIGQNGEHPLAAHADVYGRGPGAGDGFGAALAGLYSRY